MRSVLGLPDGDLRRARCATRQLGPQGPALPAAATPVAETTASGGHGAGAPAGVEGVGAAAGEYQKVVLPHCLRQPDLPGQGSDVSDLLTVTGDEGALLHLLQVRLVVDADDGDLVVSEQFPFDRSPNVKR